MAMFKNGTHLWQSSCEAFDDDYQPGTVALWTGIYACQCCNHEVTSNEGELLPPQNHHHHASLEAIRWKLVVYADQRPKPHSLPDRVHPARS